MQWSASISKIFGGNRGAALQLLSGVFGLVGVVYGLHTLMVERAKVPMCSAELLAAVGEENLLREQALIVEVAGAVVQSGVWEFAVGSRVADAIQQAGGFSQRADRTFSVQGLNLARTLTDGEKLYIPFEGETVAQNSPNQNPGSAGAAQTAGISVNSASTTELQTLPGIGEARAAQIIENRPYASLDELLSKKVLGESLLEDLQGLIIL